MCGWAGWSMPTQWVVNYVDYGADVGELEDEIMSGMNDRRIPIATTMYDIDMLCRILAHDFVSIDWSYLAALSCDWGVMRYAQCLGEAYTLHPRHK